MKEWHGVDSSFKKEILHNFLLMTCLFLLSFVFVYQIGGIIRDVFFLGILFLSFKSKRDYFWIAFFLVLIQKPAFFFTKAHIAAAYRLPLYSFLPGMSFTIFDFFLFILMFKIYYQEQKKRKLEANKYILIMAAYFVLISLPVSFVLGVNIDVLVSNLRHIFYYFFVYLFFQKIVNLEELIKIGYIIFPFMFLILFDQIYTSFTGAAFINLFDPTGRATAVNSFTGTIRPIVGGAWLVFLILVCALMIKDNKKYELFNGFSDIIVVSAIFSIILSATRSWTFMVLTVFVVFFFQSQTKIYRVIQMAVIIIFLYLGATFLNIFPQSILKDSFTRIKDTVAKQDSRDEMLGLESRFEEDAAHIFEGVKSSPVLGLGISQSYFRHYDNDVGFPNTILQWGIAGFLMILIYLGRLIKYLIRIRIEATNRLHKQIAGALLAGFCGMLIGWAFTQDLFSFYPAKIFFISFVFASVDLLYRKFALNSNPDLLSE